MGDICKRLIKTPLQKDIDVVVKKGHCNIEELAKIHEERARQMILRIRGSAGDERKAG